MSPQRGYDIDALLTERDQLAAENAAPRKRLAEAEELLSEIWNSVPATYDPHDPTVKRHAAALNKIAAFLREAEERTSPDNTRAKG